jgi:uncharacterized protein (DUF2147 family)
MRGSWRGAAGAFLGAAALACALAAGAQESPAGLWESVSDVDGKPSAHIRISGTDGEFLGTVEEILNPAKRDAVCEHCTDERANRPVLGMRILNGMRRDGEGWAGGKILDPDNGNVYSCKMKLIDGGRRLEVRGFIGFSLFGRSQTWNRLP